MIKKFFKNKSVGYYLACGAALASLILLIVIAVSINAAMPNSAAGKGPGTIIAFLIGSLVIQLAFIVVPSYSFVEIIALVLLGCSFYKELYCCPQALSALVTGVAYEGGSATLHIIYIVFYIIIFGLAIAAEFVGVFKNADDSAEEYKMKKEGKMNLPSVIKAASVAAVIVASILTSTLVSNNIMSKLSGKTDTTETDKDKPEDDKKVSPITDEIKATCEAYDYSFDPSSIHFAKEDLADEEGKFDFSTEAGISALPTNGNREGYNLVYKFEGSYAEGWQGDYSKTYAYLYLWEDGKFAGTSGSTQFRGYWYDNPDADGNATTLVMVTSNESNGEIIAYDATGFYRWIVDLDSSVNQGRRIKANGYLYYPEVALFIDTGETNLETITVGSVVDVSGWTAQRVLKNQKYSSCYEDNSNKVSWKVNGENISNSEIKVTAAGTYTVTAKWGELTATVSFTVA